ncbi:MAG TPA: CBS domain-containing protein [Candidatus Omnitrophota bacterium]|nr:CBS domain-containing protein [Candidatus Omnitrophota bacterium]HPS19687.1 CBS domain-containing protein [Candidatus Omnitrophota bacterium]
MQRRKFLGIITGDVITVTEDVPLPQVAKLMKDNDIGVIVVLNDGKVVGMVTERDIIRNVLADNVPVDSVKARDVMTRQVVMVELKEGLNNIYKTLCEMKFRHLLVMDNQKLVGITSRRDLLDVLLSKKG